MISAPFSSARGDTQPRSNLLAALSLCEELNDLPLAGCEKDLRPRLRTCSGLSEIGIDDGFCDVRATTW